MTQVSDVSRQYAVGSKQAAAAATQLNALAGDLRASITQFTLEDGDDELPTTERILAELGEVPAELAGDERVDEPLGL
jgi:uncharacterized protein involved in exopolysaccharide biosynthesis